MQIVNSIPIPVNPTVSSLMPGQALSFVKVGNEMTLAPYSATNTEYAGFFVAQNGVQALSVDQLNKQAVYGVVGVFNVPVATALIAGDKLYLDPITGFYNNTAPGAGYTKQVGVALTSATKAGEFVAAEMIKSY